MQNRVFKINEIPADMDGKRWYIVNTWVDYYSANAGFFASCRLADAVEICGYSPRYDSGRALVVKVKNHLKKWEKAESLDNVTDALEYLWECKKISGNQLASLLTSIRHAVVA